MAWAAIGQSGELISNVATFALQQRLASYDSVNTDVECTFSGLFSGQVDGVRITGRAWASSKQLSVRDLDFSVGKVQIDTNALMQQRAVKIKGDPPRGAAVVTMDARDFGSFCNHPLMQKASMRAVKNMRFQFGPPEDVSIRDGAVRFTGTWPALKTTYALLLKPLPSGLDGTAEDDIVITATATACTGDPAKVPPSHETVLGAELTRFFKRLLLDLQGAELRYAAMQMEGEEQIRLRLNLRVRQFPPLNIEF